MSVAALVLLLLMSAIVGDASSQRVDRFWTWAVEDAVGLGARTLPMAPVFLAAAGLVIPASRRLDEEVLDQVQSGYHGAWGDYLDVANEFGSRHVWIPATSLFAASLAFGDEYFQDAAFTSMESLFASVALTAAAKRAVGRPRPKDDRGSVRLRPFSGNVSFPSGHTTVAFAVVTPWVYYYPGPLTYSLLALSATTGVARIAKDMHWPTDVAAGAAVGFLTGRWLAKRHLNGSAGGMIVHPFVSPNSVGLVVRLP